eukprot:GHUV01019776.1.p1 GENE.GHUV01019776.1~~GHUV01019776.1.p1  ORF type:complete len:339 (+),score=48.81 GHUV01019776.1:260-1276(+)
MSSALLVGGCCGISSRNLEEFCLAHAELLYIGVVLGTEIAPNFCKRPPALNVAPFSLYLLDSLVILCNLFTCWLLLLTCCPAPSTCYSHGFNMLFLSPPGVAPSSAIFMAVYEPVKQWVYRNSSEDRHWLGPVVAGAAAGAAASLTRVPTEVIKQRLQTREFAGAMSAIRNIVAKEGVRGLYAGYGAFMLRDLPFDAIEFVAYEQLRKAAAKFLQRDPNPAEVSVVGALAGGFTGIVTTPLDVLKTRLMTQGTTGRYKNLIDATIQIAKTEGMSAFMAGWQPRLIWISLGGFVFFPALEAAKKLYSPDGRGMHPSPSDTAFVIEELEVEEERRLKKKK